MYDLVIILMGGLEEDRSLPASVLARIESGVVAQPSGPFLLSGAGTVHQKPVFHSQGHQLLECEAAWIHLLERGTPSCSIIAETSAHDTIGNAFFTRVAHVDVRNFKKILIVTSEFHLSRVKALFSWIYGLDGGKHVLEFIGAPNAGISESQLQEKRKKEQQRIKELVVLKEKISSLAQLHRWLYTEHEAYAEMKR